MNDNKFSVCVTTFGRLEIKVSQPNERIGYHPLSLEIDWNGQAELCLTGDFLPQRYGNHTLRFVIKRKPMRVVRTVAAYAMEKGALTEEEATVLCAAAKTAIREYRASREHAERLLAELIDGLEAVDQ